VAPGIGRSFPGALAKETNAAQSPFDVTRVLSIGKSTCQAADVGDGQHVDESDWNGRGSALRGLTGGSAPRLEQKHDVRAHRWADVSCWFRRCGGLGTADADWRASLMGRARPSISVVQRLKAVISQHAWHASHRSLARCAEASGIRRGLVPAEQLIFADRPRLRDATGLGHVAPPVRPFRAAAFDRRR
jgi:hypothetical protein